MTRARLRMFVGAGALVATVAVTPAASATDIAIQEGPCRNPSAAWNISVNPVHVEVDFDDGRICITAE